MATVLTTCEKRRPDPSSRQRKVCSACRRNTGRLRGGWRGELTDAEASARPELKMSEGGRLACVFRESSYIYINGQYPVDHTVRR